MGFAPAPPESAGWKLDVVAGRWLAGEVAQMDSILFCNVQGF
jgi:hypothetical protein